MERGVKDSVYRGVRQCRAVSFDKVPHEQHDPRENEHSDRVTIPSMRIHQFPQSSQLSNDFKILVHPYGDQPSIVGKVRSDQENLKSGKYVEWHMGNDRHTHHWNHGDMDCLVDGMLMVIGIVHGDNLFLSVNCGLPKKQSIIKIFSCK